MAVPRSLQVARLELSESDLMNVDRNQNWIGNLALVIVESNNSASRGHLDAVHVAIVVGVIESSGSAHDVNNIFVPAQQSFLAEVGDLFARVACDVVRKNRLLAAAILLRFPAREEVPRSQIPDRYREMGS